MDNLNFIILAIIVFRIHVNNIYLSDSLLIIIIILLLYFGYMIIHKLIKDLVKLQFWLDHTTYIKTNRNKQLLLVKQMVEFL